MGRASVFFAQRRRGAERLRPAEGLFVIAMAAPRATIARATIAHATIDCAGGFAANLSSLRLCASARTEKMQSLQGRI